MAASQASRKYLRRLIARYKVFVGCAKCGYRRSSRALHYHHRPGEVKLFDVGSAHRHAGRKRIVAEMRKCDVLCANCHHEHHGEYPDASDLR